MIGTGIVTVTIVVPLAVYALGSGSPQAESAAKPDGAQPTRLYYQDGYSLRSTTLGKHPTTRRVARVSKEGAQMAVRPAHVFWTSCTTIPPDNLFRFDRKSRRRVRMVGNLDCPSGLVVADGHVYWASDANIGRINTDGTGLERSFLRAANVDAGDAADGLATDGIYLYFTRCGSSAIGRIRLDGSDLNRRFISTGDLCPQPLAYSDGYLYWGWSDDSGQASHGIIGRASTDGRRIRTRWLDTGINGAPNLVTGAGRLFYAWGGPHSIGFIGEALLNGRTVTRHFAVGSEPLALGP